MADTATQSPSNPPTVSLLDFRSVIAAGNDVAKQSRFVLRITRASPPADNSITRDLSFLCVESELPSRTLNADEVRYYGPTFKLPYQSAYTDIESTFICRDTMLEKVYFDDWLAQINPKSSYDFDYLHNYAADIEIFQFTHDNKASYKCTLREAYPLQAAALKLSWAEDGLHYLRVVFAYTDWVTDKEKQEKNFELVENATNIRSSGSVFGSQIRFEN